MNETMYRFGFIETCKAYGITKSAADAMYLALLESGREELEKVASVSESSYEDSMHYAGFIDTCAQYGIEKTAADELYKEAIGLGWLKGLWGGVKALGSTFKNTYKAQKALGTAAKTYEQAAKATKGLSAVAKKGTPAYEAWKAFRASKSGLMSAERAAAGVEKGFGKTKGLAGFFKKMVAAPAGMLGRIRGQGFRGMFQGMRGGWNGVRRFGAAPKNSLLPPKAPVKPVAPAAPAAPAAPKAPKKTVSPTDTAGPTAGKGGKAPKPPADTATATSDVGGAADAAKHWWNMSPLKSWGQWIGRHPKTGIASVAIPFSIAGGMAAHNPYTPEVSTVNTLTPSQRMMYDNIYGGDSMEGLGSYTGGYF